MKNLFRFPALLAGAYGLGRSLILALIVSLLAFFGAFQSADLRLYDFFVRHTPELSPVQRQVVLLEGHAPFFERGGVDWLRLVDELVSRGAEQVVFSVRPEGSDAMLSALSAHSKVVLGAPVDQPSPQADREPGQAQSALPAAAIPGALNGMHRWQDTRHRGNTESIPALEAVAARRLGAEVPDSGPYLIDFRHPASGFGRIALDEALAGQLASSLVKGRVVLVGPAAERTHRTYATPREDARGEISALEYHAYALDALLRGTAIAMPPRFADVGLLLVLGALCFLAFQPMTFRKAVAVASGVALATLGLAWSMLALHMHIPVVGALLMLGATLLAVFQSKTERQNEALERMVMETHLASTQSGGNNQGARDAFWPHAAAMIDQILPLNRMVLLERMGQGKHLREVYSLRCQIDTVAERRRDFERAPYRNAVDKDAAIEVSGYLKAGTDDEQQFLMPLAWG
ncbi:MAG TPA: CHASE2 domain-containing protein, partial [Noviherbaspirillum sp.]|nr:CHASE2 domain-containing protein [Noviherbaspirillum sp.]